MGQIGVELQLPSDHEWRGMYWYWDFVITTKRMTEDGLWMAKRQLQAVKAQMEVSVLGFKDLDQSKLWILKMTF